MGRNSNLKTLAKQKNRWEKSEAISSLPYIHFFSLLGEGFWWERNIS